MKKSQNGVEFQSNSDRRKSKWSRNQVKEESKSSRRKSKSLGSIGELKTESAKRRIKQINPEIIVDIFGTRLTIENAKEIIDGYDIIVDGTDNFATRYTISDCCEILGKPWVFGSIHRFEGQVSVFNLNGSPNYRDLFPKAPPPELAPNCAEAGVLGVLPGIIGSFQANEVLKIVLEKGICFQSHLP